MIKFNLNKFDWVTVKFPEGNFTFSKRNLKRFKTIYNIINDTKTSEIDLCDTPVKYEVFKHLLKLNAQTKDPLIILEMLIASDFLEDIRLQYYCDYIKHMIYKKLLKPCILKEMPYHLLSLIRFHYTTSEQFVNLFGADEDLLQMVIPLVEMIDIEDIDHLPLLKGIKNIDCDDIPIPIEYLKYLSESESVSVKLKTLIEEFPNPNGCLLHLNLIGKSIPLNWKNLNSITKLSVNYTIGNNIRYLTNITDLEIYGDIKTPPVSVIDLSNCSKLTSLTFKTTYYNIYGSIKTISNPEILENFSITTFYISEFIDIGLDHHFSGLKRFTCKSKKLRNLRGIKDLVSLETIQLWYVLRETDILEIFNLPNIKEIKLHMKYVPENIHKLENVSNSLKKISISSFHSVLDLNFLRKLKSVQIIHISNVDVENWEFLLNLENIKRFSSNCTNFNDLSYLQNKDKILSIDLTYTSVRSIQIDMFENLRSLCISSKFNIILSAPYPKNLKRIEFRGKCLSFNEKIEIKTLDFRTITIEEITDDRYYRAILPLKVPTKNFL